MSDNAKCYATSFEFRDTLAELGARHILIPPRTPRWNGKIERFFGTLDREWAHGRVWSNSTQRDRALASFIRFYNRRRPHSACGGRRGTETAIDVTLRCGARSHETPLPSRRTVPRGSCWQ